ncbi:MAG: hypothetical protein ACXWPM_13165, partial [Bdellovibrionota bacterium]
MKKNLKLVTCFHILGMALLIGASACSKPAYVKPAVQNIEVKKDQPRPDARGGVTDSFIAKMTVDKAAFLSQEFLYGADLQYSSLYDDDMDLYNQSLAIGSIPARFRISDDELQLVADNRRLYPSDVNHPEQVLTRFKIYAQTETTLTISGANSSVFLAQVFEGSHTDTKGALVNPAGKPPRDHWIRSFDYDPKGNYLLQQSSIQMDDKKGSIAEIMESIYPRENTKPGKDFQKFQMDPEDPIGASDGPANRYRFLPGEK